MKIIQAQEEHFDIVRELFREYQTSVDEASANQCFEGFEEELANLPGSYIYPQGIIYIAFTDSEFNKSENAIGCIAIRPREENPKEGEIKRLYVQSQKRGSGAGRKLFNTAFQFAKEAGYSGLYLETTGAMQAAQSLYKSYGFKKINTADSCHGDSIVCYQYLFTQDD